MINVNLVVDAGMPWYRANDCWVKGSVCEQSGSVIELDALVASLKDVQSCKDLKKVVVSLHGIFAIVVLRHGKVLVAGDITRTFPIFFMIGADCLHVTDDIWTFPPSLRGPLLGEACNEFLCTGYTVGRKTVYASINQLQSAEIAELTQNSYTSLEYWNYLATSQLDDNFQSLQQVAISLIEMSITRLVNSLRGRTALVPLSGGYDSRVILASLFKLGFRDVHCFTYGDPMSKEIKVAKSIAAQLGYPIHAVALTPEFIKSGFDKEQLQQYMKFAFNGVSVPHLQDFLVVKYLHENELIPSDSVFIPGHSGDIFAGSHIVGVDESSSREDVTKAIFKKHYWLSSHSNDFELDYNDMAPPFSNMESWSWKERQGKFIVNSIRTYEFFDYESRIPLWDIDLASFFRNVPLKFKNRRNKKAYSIDSNLYDSVCHIIFRQAGLNTAGRNEDSLLTRVLRRCSALLFSVDGVNNIDQISRCFEEAEKIRFKSRRFNGRIAELQLHYLKGDTQFGRAENGN